MRPHHMGDDYDIVKREIMRSLALCEEWAVHPMYFDRGEGVQRSFPSRHASFLQARLVPGNIWDRDEVVATAIQCRGHLLLDPDSGIWLGKNLTPLYGSWDRHLKDTELVQIAQGSAREGTLTLVFADTQRDNFGPRYKRITRMLTGIRRRHEIHGSGYVSSRMALVWVSVDGELVKEATDRLVSGSALPRWRVAGAGGEGQ